MPTPTSPHPSQAELLLRYLKRESDHLVANLEGLDDYDVRRPMTPTGTSLLGLVKHVASVTFGYFGDCSGRPTGVDLPWDNEEGYLTVHMLAEVAHHAGHADIIREAIDGRGGSEQSEVGDAQWWEAFVARVQAEADAHRG